MKQRARRPATAERDPTPRPRRATPERLSDAIQQTAGNRAAIRLYRSPQAATRPRPATPAPILRPLPDGPMTRAAFATEMRRRFGVGRIRTGTLATQCENLNRLGGPAQAGTTRPGDLLARLDEAGSLAWREWDPGGESDVYTGLARGFEDFGRSMGGIPPVDEVVFYRVDYRTTTAAPGLVEEGGVGATYSGGRLHVYQAAATSPNRIPVERDAPGRPGRRPTPPTQDSVANFAAHELGHGLQEVALTPPRPDAAIMNDYQRTVGWVGGLLFDAGDPALTTELEAGRRPRGAMPITAANWNSGRWHEQPISAYMTTSAFEDFPEAVMAFVRAPEALRARAPRRYEFIHNRRDLLAPHLRAIRLPPPLGDFPTPRDDRRYA